MLLKTTFTGNYLRNLSLFTFIAIVAGVATGYFFPTTAISFNDGGGRFLKLLEIIVLPVIFLAIVQGICNLSQVPHANRMMWQTAIYFICITSLCILLGFAFAGIIKPGEIINSNLKDFYPALPRFYEKKDYNGQFSIVYRNRHVLFLLLAIGLGIYINLSANKEKMVIWLNCIQNFILKIVKYTYLLLPFIIFCNIAYSISIYGLHALIPLSKVLATVYLANIVFIFGLLGLIARLFGFNLWDLLVLLKEEILLVMATSSSKTAFPMIFEKLQAKGYDINILGFVIPLGYCFNLAGACIYIAVSSIFFVQFYKISMSFTDYLWLFAIISFTSKTASGVPGSGFLALVFTMGRFHIPTADIALLYAVDRFMNEARSITNFIGITVCGVVINKLNLKKISRNEKRPMAFEETT
ncbi:dicarboxylate/amino acid:cation symporter [Sphingobacterium deserti]|uniref:Sodium:dicarboxylate symporter n=1 Tax=Sphingobacterium deserti TaxID=1229276 RepID=A0A0B8T369_9SPHI|nr:cation:dicarboxylase symporter family transporter [Sphingobacterium deserti]KGE15932.1 sodium:dicarboxylate symporter [Sphingobacterium deserti]